MGGGNNVSGFSHYFLHMTELCDFSKIILNNWLLNPTGDPNSWVELDLVQEHLNFWIKVSLRLIKVSFSDRGQGFL